MPNGYEATYHLCSISKVCGVREIAIYFDVAMHFPLAQIKCLFKDIHLIMFCTTYSRLAYYWLATFSTSLNFPALVS